LTGCFDYALKDTSLFIHGLQTKNSKQRDVQ